MSGQHIAESMHKKFGGEFKAYFSKIARAPTRTALNTTIQTLQRASPEAEEYIASIGYNSLA